MKITPLDVDQQQFQTVFRGFDGEEVRTFLNQVSRQLEELGSENQRLKEQLRRQEHQLDEFRAHESQLREALSSASRMTDEIKEGARKEAELIRAEAQVEGEKIIAEARADLARLTEESRSLRLQKTRLLSELRTVMDSHRRLLETQEQLDRQLSAGRQNGASKSVRAANRR